MPTFEELLSAARVSRGLLPGGPPPPDPRSALERHFANLIAAAGPDPAPGPCPVCGKPMARVPGRPDYCPETVCAPPGTFVPPQPGFMRKKPTLPPLPPPPAPEPFVCRTCHTVRDFAASDHDGAQYLRRKCAACLTSGARQGRQLAIWERIRNEVEFQDGDPAGTWRPAAGNPLGVWEKSPDRAAADAEVARRIARS